MFSGKAKIAIFPELARPLPVQLVGGSDETRDVLVADMEILHFAGEILVVGGHVDETVAGEVEEDGLLLAGLLALERFADRGGDGVAGLGCGDDAFGPGEEDAGLEGLELFDVDRFHEAVFHQLGHDDACAVVAETARVDGRRFEGVAEGVHRQERGGPGLVAEVIFELAAGELRAGIRLGRDEAGLLAVPDVVAHERIGDAGEIGAAAEAGDDDVRIFARQGHLLLGFQADDRLVEADMVQHGAEGVFAVRGAHRQLDGLGNGAAERALVVGVDGQDVLSGPGGHGRGRGDRRPEGLHDAAAVGLLVEADLDHVDGALDAEFLRGVGKGPAPLASAGLRGDVGDALLLGIPGLCEGGVELVGTGGGNALVLEIDVGGGAERFFQFIGTHERGATVGGILLADGLRDRDPFVGHVEFLVGAGLAEDRVQVFRLHRLAGRGVEDRQGLVGHDGLHVEEMSGDLALGEHEFFLFHFAKCFIVVVNCFLIVPFGEAGAGKMKHFPVPLPSPSPEERGAGAEAPGLRRDRTLSKKKGWRLGSEASLEVLIVLS